MHAPRRERVGGRKKDSFIRGKISGGTGCQEKDTSNPGRSENPLEAPKMTIEINW